MKKLKIVILAAFFVILAGIGVGAILSRDITFSENENRNLQDFPALSWSDITSGKAMTEFESYLKDHVPGRDLLMATGTRIKKAAGRTDIGGAYIGKEHYYFEKVTDADIDEKRFEKNLRLVEHMAEENADISFSVMLVPSASLILKDKLPADAQVYDGDALYQTAAQMLTGCALIDPREALLDDTASQLYYRTDHHWTLNGAYIGYQAFMNHTGKASDSDFTGVTDDFYGTLYSKTLDADAVPDSILTYPAAETVTVTEDGSPAELYDTDALTHKDKYRVYLGGNCGITEIKNTAASADKGTLVVIKDSFANCMASLLAEDYADVILIDPRYYPGSVNAFLENVAPDQVLVLYELSNFAGDSNIAKLAM